MDYRFTELASKCRAFEIKFKEVGWFQLYFLKLLSEDRFKMIAKQSSLELTINSLDESKAFDIFFRDLKSFEVKTLAIRMSNSQLPVIS